MTRNAGSNAPRTVATVAVTDYAAAHRTFTANQLTNPWHQ